MNRLGEARRRLAACLRRFPLLGWAGVAAVVAAALIPNARYGWVPSGGLSAATRVEIGGGLLTGAVVGLLLAAYEHHREESFRTSRRRVACAPVDDAAVRLLREVAGRVAMAVQHMEKRMRDAPDTRIAPDFGSPARRWGSGELQTLVLAYALRLMPVLRPARSVEDANVYLAVVHIMQSLLDAGASADHDLAVSGLDLPGGQVPLTRLVGNLSATAQAASAQLMADADSDAVTLSTLAQHLEERWSVAAFGTDDQSLGVVSLAARVCGYLHGAKELSARTAALRACPPSDDPDTTVAWWGDPEQLIDWVERAGQHLRGGGDPAALLPAPIRTVPLSVA